MLKTAINRKAVQLGNSILNGGDDFFRVAKNHNMEGARYLQERALAHNTGKDAARKLASGGMKAKEGKKALEFAQSSRRAAKRKMYESAEKSGVKKSKTIDRINKRIDSGKTIDTSIYNKQIAKDRLAMKKRNRTLKTLQGLS